MFGSTTPLTERPDLHPVHRANAMLRSALLSEAASFAKPGFTQAFDAIAGPEDGPIGIACPQSLVARLNALDIGLQAGIRVPLSFASRRRSTMSAIWHCPRRMTLVSPMRPP